jgi:hypothetical protein
LLRKLLRLAERAEEEMRRRREPGLSKEAVVGESQPSEEQEAS